MLRKASDIARAVDGLLVGDDVAIAGVTQDSRALVPGYLFVPLSAERDGHDFIDAAIAAGASAYLSARGHRGGTAILVDDTARALGRLGAAARDLLPDRVIGITGSVGKTSTKDLVASVLATTYRTHSSDRSFNNEIGVPLTLLNVPDGTEAVVVEKGARGRGHIAALCAIARPTIGVVTVVGGAHLELFGTIEDVAHTKGELIEAIPAGGVAVLNADDPRVAAMASRSAARVLTYGSTGDVRGTDIEMAHDLTSRFELHSPWGRATVVLGVRGRHNVDNALAAACVGLASGLDLDAVVEGLRTPASSPWRMDLRRAVGGAQVLNDAYNANPVSVRAALEALVHLPARRRVAVLGPMAELGAESDEEHRRIGELARSLGVRVLAIDAPGYGGEPVDGIDEALALLAPLDHDVAVLVKGSRVAGLERLVDRLLHEAG